MQCTHCSSTDFRLSGLRRGDIPHLLLMRYPVRCRDCHERLYGGLLYALSLRRSQGLFHPKGSSGAPQR
jgi:hypothetical protein